MVDPEISAKPNDPVVLRTWKVDRFSFFGSLVPIYLIVVGVALICAGVVLLGTDWSSHQRTGFLWIVFVGTVGLGSGTLSFQCVVRQVDALADGHYRFTSRRRVVVEEASDIVSLKGLAWTDFWGAYPFQMKTRSATMLIDRHMREGKDLEYELRQANPHMVVKRAWEAREADSAPWRGEDLWEP